MGRAFTTLLATILLATGISSAVFKLRPGDDFTKAFIAARNSSDASYEFMLADGEYLEQSALFASDFQNKNVILNGENSKVVFKNFHLFFFNFDQVTIKGVSFSGYSNGNATQSPILELSRVNSLQFLNSSFSQNNFSSSFLHFAGTHLSISSCNFTDNVITTSEGNLISVNPKDESSNVFFGKNNVMNNRMMGSTSTYFIYSHSKLNSTLFNDNFLFNNSFNTFFYDTHHVQQSQLIGNQFIQNDASFYVCSFHSGSLQFQIENSTFDSNRPPSSRIIDLVGPTIDFRAKKLRFVKNQNAIHFESSKGGFFSLETSTFLNNTAVDGAALFVKNNQQVNTTIFKSTFIGNSAKSHGGALWIFQDIYIFNSTFALNKAVYGSAVASNNSLTFYSEFCTFNATQTVWVTAGSSIYAPGFNNKNIKCETGRVQNAKRDNEYFCPEKSNDQMVGFFLMGGIGILFVLTLVFLGYRIVSSRRRAKETYVTVN